MSNNNKENQTAYRERLYAAGYKQTRIWVPREGEGKAVKITRLRFVKAMDALTAGWSNAKLSRLFSNFLKIIEKENQEKKKDKKEKK